MRTTFKNIRMAFFFLLKNNLYTQRNVFITIQQKKKRIYISANTIFAHNNNIFGMHGWANEKNKCLR